MDLVGIRKYIEDWLTKNEGRANSLGLKIQKITDEYLEICIDRKVLQVTIPPSIYRSCSADGVISNPSCPFISTLAEGKLGESNIVDAEPELMTDLNEKLDRLSNREYYSFSSVLDSIIDIFEKYKYCSNCDGEIDEEEEEDAWSNDGEGYFVDGYRTGTLLGQSQGSQKNEYFDQLIEDANTKCDRARSVAMCARTEVPSNENIKDSILRWCKLYSPSLSNWCVGFEIELCGILSEYYRDRHGHVFETLGFSFATPLLIELMFEPISSTSKSTILEGQGELLGGAFKGLWAMHDDGNYDPTGREDPDEQISRVIDVSKPNPIHQYGLESLLPRMAKDFFCRQGRDPDNDINNALFACEDNIFVRFLLFTGSRLASLLKRCIVCNKELPFTVSRLCSCTEELCLFGFEVLGLGAQVLQELIRMPMELIDLEISLALAAAESFRDVFEPFPPFLLEKREIRQRSQLENNDNNPNPSSRPLINWRPSNNLRENQNKNENIHALKSIITSFPPVSEMRLCADEVKLKENLAKSWLSTAEGKSKEKSGDKYFGKEAWQLPYNVLRFILCTNRLSLVFLSENDDKVLKVNNCQSQLYQFAVVQDSPEREAVYIESYKSKQPVSIFGFHGSPRENWYSILRNGLRCFSNTKLMSSGNSLGDGIYLSTDFELSARYANTSIGIPHSWMNGIYMNGFYVVSICEVMSSPTINEHSRIFMVPKQHERSVAVRYLLVFKENLNSLSAGISDGHTLFHRGHSVDLSQHYQSIRQKYASGYCSL